MPELVPFIGEDDLEAVLGETIANPSALIVTIALDSACQRVRSYLGQMINLVEDDVEVHSGSGRRKLRLRQRPVVEVTSVVVDDQVVDPAEYKVRGAVVTLPESAWAYGNDNVEITYTHGWDVAEPSDNNVPADIRLAALSLARRVYLDVGTTVGGDVIQETIGDYSYKLSEAATEVSNQLTSAEEMLLDPYKVELVGDTPTY